MDTKGHDEATSTMGSSGTHLSSGHRSLNTFSTLEVVQHSDLEAYKNASEMPQWQFKGVCVS
jgi:hypothetical protein